MGCRRGERQGHQTADPGEEIQTDVPGAGHQTPEDGVRPVPSYLQVQTLPKTDILVSYQILEHVKI